MPMPFPDYIKVKDKYCCLYLGNAPEYLVILRLLKPQIEKQLPGLQFWIGYKDEFKYLLEGENNVIPLSQINKDEFAYIKELRNNANSHSVLELMKESNLSIMPVIEKFKSKFGLCLICPEGISPVKSVAVKPIIERVSRLGYTPMVVGSDIHYSLDIKIRPKDAEKLKYLEIEEVSWIVGVENEYLFLGAAKGIRTTLIQSGFGALLFKQLFPCMNSVQSVEKIVK